MRLSLIVVFIVVVAVADDDVNETALPGNLGTDHVGLVVPSVAMASEYLIDAFGCVHDWTVTRERYPSAGERGWDKRFGVHADSYLRNVSMVNCGEYHLAQYIELFEWVSPDQQPLPTNSAGENWFAFSDLGNSYIAFTFADVRAAHQHLASVVIPKWGGRLVSEPMQFPLRGELCTSFFVVTPWGQWIELSDWSESTPKHPLIKSTLNMYDSDAEALEAASQTAPKMKPHRDVGSPIDTLDTPFVWIDLDAFERNIALLQSRLAEAEVMWIPPVKAHKSPALAHRLISQGAPGILCLKLAEAEIFADNGHTKFIYIANQVIGARKLHRLVQLAKRVERLRINVDSVEQIVATQNAAAGAGVVIEVMVEVNIGHNRGGVTPEVAVKLSKLAFEKDSLKFGGLAGYEGHTPVLPPKKKTEETQKAHAILGRARKLVEEAGLVVFAVSGGGSSNYVDALATGVLTELQAGGVALCDKLYLYQAHLANHGHEAALYVNAAISTAHADRAMGDAGFKTLGWHPFAGLPQLVNRPGVEPWGLSAEHLKLRPENGTEASWNLKEGDVIQILPGYGDSFLFMNKQIYGIREGLVEEVFPILATGASQ